MCFLSVQKCKKVRVYASVCQVSNRPKHFLYTLDMSCSCAVVPTKEMFSCSGFSRESTSVERTRFFGAVLTRKFNYFVLRNAVLSNSSAARL